MRMFPAPWGMWVLFKKSFQKNLGLLGVSDARGVMRRAKAKYREIVLSLPPYGKNDILRVNILSAASLAAIFLSLPKRGESVHMALYLHRGRDARQL